MATETKHTPTIQEFTAQCVRLTDWQKARKLARKWKRAERNGNIELAELLNVRCVNLMLKVVRRIEAKFECTLEEVNAKASGNA